MVLEDLLLLNATPLRCLALAVPVAAAAGLLVEQFDQWSIAVLDGLGVAMPLGLQRDVIELQVVRGLSELGLTLVATALVPAVCEEAFFRGLAFTGLCAHRGPAIAVVGSAALFAATHFSPWHLPALFLLGLLLAALTYWTHSVYPAVVAHLTNNLLAVGEVNLEAYSGVDLLGNGIRWGVLALAAAVLVVGLALVRRQKPIMPLPVWASARPDPLSNDAPG
jgi:membrane protease YdiL (CAAX protease family)